MKIKIVVTILILLTCALPVNAGLIFDSGYNIYDESYGSNAEVSVINDAILDVFGGDITVYLVSTDIAAVNLYDGEINELWTKDNSVATIIGGQIHRLKYEGSSLIYLYAYNVVYHPTGGGDWGNSPWVEGIYFQDNSHFDFMVPGSEELTFSYVKVIPEPTIILLLSLGSLFVIRKRK